MFVNIEDDEETGFNRQHAAFKTGKHCNATESCLWYKRIHLYLLSVLPPCLGLVEIKRVENQGKSLMSTLNTQKEQLASIGDDEGVDTQLRTAGRQAVNVETKLREMQRMLRKDIRKKDIAFCVANGVPAETPHRPPDELLQLMPPGSAMGSPFGSPLRSRSLAGSALCSAGSSMAGTRVGSPALSRVPTVSKLAQRSVSPLKSTKPSRPVREMIPLQVKNRTVILDAEARARREKEVHDKLCTPVFIPFTEDEAIAVVQRYWRRFKIQIAISELYCKQVIQK